MRVDHALHAKMHNKMAPAERLSIYTRVINYTFMIKSCEFIASSEYGWLAPDSHILRHGVAR